MELCRWAIDSIRRLWRWFFPAQRDIEDCLKPWLEHVFPDLDLGRVRFYEGLPVFIKPRDPAAITLPSIWGTRRINVYYRDGHDPCSCAGLKLIAHEMVHVRQYLDYAGGYGLGFVRAFLFPYLLCALRHGYRDSPLEEEAYDFDDEIGTCCEQGREPCDCSSSQATKDTAGLASWKSNCGHIVMESTSVTFWRHMWSCVPGLRAWWDRATRVWRYCREFLQRRLRDATSGAETITDRPTKDGVTESAGRLFWRIFAAWAQSVFVCIGTSLLAILMWFAGIVYWIVAMALLLVVVLGIAILWAAFKIVWVVATGIWAVVAGFLCLLDAIWWAIKKIWSGLVWLWRRLKDLWSWFKGVLSDACEWGRRLERSCEEWEVERRKKCAEEKEEREKKCAQEKEEREKKCAEEREERRKNCCTWRPCSWACRSWTWITNVVCVAWKWVTNVVCVAWTWVTNVVCVAWTWIVTRTCKAFTWTVKRATCWA
jgi:hypothetical protein